MANQSNTLNRAAAIAWRLVGLAACAISSVIAVWVFALVLGLSPVQSAEYQPLAILEGDAKHRILMPPKHMQREIVARMNAGTLKFRPMSMSQLKRDCDGSHAEYRLLACAGNVTATLMGGVNVRVWDRLQGRDLQLVLIHEFAHALYGWKH